MRNLTQKRAKFALDKVNDIINPNSKYSNVNNKNFKSFAAGAPTIILQNGLAQALAFWASKVKSNNTWTNEKYILHVITSWFSDAENPLHFSKDKLDNLDNFKFIKIILEKDQSEYLAIQRETLALLEWFKRYANAFLNEDKKQDNGDN